MEILTAGLILFLGIHSISIFNPAFRDRMAARLGEDPWKGVFALIAIAGFILIVWGYGLARQEPILLYTPPLWLRHLVLLLMLPVFPLFIAAYFPGRIKSAVGHPMLAATKLWAFSHLLANGTLHDILLFGGFLAWAVADLISMKNRVPISAPGAPVSKYNDIIVVVAGLALYVLFAFKLHAWLIGVSPVG